ncbi:hypothetical protein [Peristeroidobacter soli]|uniref:hypothetical protein n=1 Tax=Peristeroidobacter soli TaxID=2497877 RepID=UPI00101BC98F|nr:hypothetical protein [Peristeroidobacter soli]
MKSSTALALVKSAHTAVWAFFASCIILLPIAAFLGRFDMAILLIGLVAVEILVLALNHWACPLTNVAARFTADRSDNFDIYLPLLLARYNKQIFGSLFVLAVVYTAYRWHQA